MKKLVLSLILGAFAATSASAAYIDLAGFSVTNSTASSVTFTNPITGFGCTSQIGACSSPTMIFSGVANTWDGAGDGFSILIGGSNTVTFTLTAAPVAVVNGLSFVGNLTDTGSLFTTQGGNGLVTFQGNNTSFSVSANVPEPASVALLGSGLLGLGLAARRRRK